MSISIHDYNQLRRMDRILVMHKGRETVAQIDSWADGAKLRIRTHKRKQRGWVAGTTLVRRSDVLEVTSCSRLGIGRAGTRPSEPLAIGGDA